jgi:translation elongation factor EF-Tu-like GTPase
MSNGFRMLVANIYRLPGGPTVTGYIDSGCVRVGDSLTLVGAHGEFRVEVVAIQRFRESLEEAERQ